MYLEGTRIQLSPTAIAITLLDPTTVHGHCTITLKASNKPRFVHEIQFCHGVFVVRHGKNQCYGFILCQAVANVLKCSICNSEYQTLFESPILIR